MIFVAYIYIVGLTAWHDMKDEDKDQDGDTRPQISRWTNLVTY